MFRVILVRIAFVSLAMAGLAVSLLATILVAWWFPLAWRYARTPLRR